MLKIFSVYDVRDVGSPGPGYHESVSGVSRNLSPWTPKPPTQLPSMLITSIISLHRASSHDRERQKRPSDNLS